MTGEKEFQAMLSEYFEKYAGMVIDDEEFHYFYEDYVSRHFSLEDS